MSISFRGAKKYKKHNGFDKSAEIHSPLPAPVYFFNLVHNPEFNNFIHLIDKV